MNVALGRDENPVEARIGQERPQLVLNGRARLSAKAVGIQGEFMGPKAPDDGVADAGDNLFAKGLVGIETKDVRKRRSVLLQKRIEAVAKHMLHAHAPCIRPQLLQCFEKAGRRQRNLVVPDTAKRVVAERLTRGGGVEVVQPIAQDWLGDIAKALRQVPVRIDQGKPASSRQVLPREHLKQRRFADARLADHIHMREPVGLPNAETLTSAMEVGSAEV